MATTTKSSKAKSKTSKAKSTKSSSAKVTKKTTSTKVTKPVAKAATKSSSTARGAMTLLQKIYALSIAVYAAIAVAAFYLMDKTSYPLSVGYWAKDSLASNSKTVFAPASQSIFDIQARYLVMALAIVSLVGPLLYLTRLKNYHVRALKNKVLQSRWVDMAVAVAIMAETVAIVSGVLDIATLKVVGGLMVVTCVLGWMAEKRTAEAGKPATAKYYLSMVTGLLPWVLIAFYAVSTVVYGGVRTSWFVYALYAVMLVGAGVIGTHQLKSLKSEGGMKDYEAVERRYAILGLVTRTAFSVVLIVGLMAK